MTTRLDTTTAAAVALLGTISTPNRRPSTYFSVLGMKERLWIGIWVSIWVFWVSFVRIEAADTLVPHNDTLDANNGTAPPLIEATALPDVFTHDCQCSDRTMPPSGRPSGSARLFFLITVHNARTVDDAVFAFRALRGPGHIVLIHVDSKMDWGIYLNSTLYKEVTACPCGATVRVESHYDSQWSTWSMNLPTLWGMQVATTEYHQQWDVFVNLSGDTLPVYTIRVLEWLFDPYRGPLRATNFVTSSSCETGFLPSNVYIFPEYWHKRGHYTTHPKGDPNITYTDEDGTSRTIRLTTYFGSQWMALLPDFVAYLVTSLQRKTSLPSQYRDWLVRHEKKMTDETFIPTLLMHVTPFNETLPVLNENGTLKAMPSMQAIRYERMDEHVPTAFGYFPTEQRYQVPASSSADVPKIWGPYYLGTYDLGNIQHSGALFVRKVSATIDPNLARLLPVECVSDIPDIRWPAEVTLSDVPNWEKVRMELIRKAKEKQRKETEKLNVKDKVGGEELRS